MRLKTKKKMISLVLGLGAFGSLIYWYQFASTPLSQPEVEKYMAIIQAQTSTYDVRHDLGALRQFLQQDDGRPFYTVNLYKFNRRAGYASGSMYGGTGTEAYARFSSVMVALLAARASHPIFGSLWSDSAASGWDRVVIVRYRSRRDIADLFASTEFAAASVHKWASIERHERMLVQGLHFPNGLLVVGLLAAAVALMSKVYLSRKKLNA